MSSLFYDIFAAKMRFWITSFGQTVYKTPVMISGLEDVEQFNCCCGGVWEMKGQGLSAALYDMNPDGVKQHLVCMYLYVFFM